MQTLPLTPTLLAAPHRFLRHTPTNTAILSDLHLGIEHTMRQQGLAFPNINEQKIRESWRHLLATLQSRAPENKSSSETHSGNETHSEETYSESGGGVIIAGDLFDSPTPDPASINLAHELFNAPSQNTSPSPSSPATTTPTPSPSAPSSPTPASPSPNPSHSRKTSSSTATDGPQKAPQSRQTTPKTPPKPYKSRPKTYQFAPPSSATNTPPSSSTRDSSPPK